MILRWIWELAGTWGLYGFSLLVRLPVQTEPSTLLRIWRRTCMQFGRVVETSMLFALLLAGCGYLGSWRPVTGTHPI